MKVFSFPFLLAIGLEGLPLAALAQPQWIWQQGQVAPGQRVTFRKVFQVAGPAASATIRVTCDNGCKLFINESLAAENTDWDQSVKADVTRLIRVGTNQIRVEAKNTDGIAGLVASLEITSAKQKSLVETSAEWEAAAPGSTAFAPAVVVAEYMAQPWGDALKSAAKSSGLAEVDQITVPAGFRVELLYTVPKAQEGSWVAITEDNKGRMVVADQYGGLYRVTVPKAGSSQSAHVQALEMPNGLDGKPLGGAHGLLYAADSLYVMNNERTELKASGNVPNTDNGLWRVRDTDGDDKFDKAELLHAFKGSSEHGTHGVALGPDGKSIYVVNGNHTKVPGDLEYRLPVGLAEDHLTTRMWDPNGHARGIMAPGGYVVRMDLDGKHPGLFAGGFRNQYDIAFDANGELFTYDSDMEWDMGTSWYVPTRINHIVSAGDYGWRSGSGRWPNYYADSLPAVVDIGPGSPTGTIFGTGAKFPAKYQRAFFALDWTYGTMWAIHLKPEGASFSAEREDFLSGKPLPLTDAIISKKDGNMYFLLGGRKSQSALYRLSYVGKESTAPVRPLAPTPEAKLRRSLEAFHLPGTGPEAVEKAWSSLGNKDRFLRFAARAAIERQPVERWSARALSETNPQAAVEALIALARMGDKALQPKLIAALERLDLATVDPALRLPILRAWELTLIRMGKPASETAAQIVAKLDAVFPSADPSMNRELVSLLVYLGSPSVVAKTVPLLETAKDGDITLASKAVLARNDDYARAVAGMHDSRPNRQAIAYVTALREAKVGWTPELRKTFFAWFQHSSSWHGGNSFTKYLEVIRSEALANCGAEETERTALNELSKRPSQVLAANLVVPKGPGKNYSVDDAVGLVANKLTGRNFEQGKAMFASSLCVNCHHFKGEGGNIGPDITGAGSRYTLRDLMENIIEPSKVISDQYGTEQFELKDGSLVVGRAVVEENGKLFIMTSALAPDAQTTLNVADVKTRKAFNVSMMPPGLINPLNAGELLDLTAYLLSGGNPEDKAFAK